MAETILIVEDQEEFLSTIVDLLKLRGLQPLTARNGIEALKILEKENPDVILSDVEMPGMDGLTLCRTLKSHFLWRYIPVILLSARESLSDVLTGLQAGANDYLKKSFNSDELWARVSSAIQTRKIYSELKQAKD